MPQIKTLFKVLAVALMFSIYGCSSQKVEQDAAKPNPFCLGNADLPQQLADLFSEVDDQDLLHEALGAAGQGKLCQGRVYQSAANSQITVFRAWNSTNANSKLGKWWAFQAPGGKISTFRADYEICYQWSALDKLASCTLKPGAKVVLGTGQSATCSEYLTYPVSDKQQVYISDASASVNDCKTFDGEFSWQ
ncbi:MAG: hypothetical protein KUG79_06780 [Pseudomonadales bacterium]|nr:hypothetical protein [Pseudomonadales bacterium]